MTAPVVAVIGAGACDAATAELARRVGAELARAGCVVVTGGLGGVMEAASAGAAGEGGTVVGVLPGADRRAANRWVTAAVATGMGDARNAIIANTADGFVALPGCHGTRSEIAFALKRGKPVVALADWDFDPAIERAAGAADAVARVLARLRG